MKLQKTVINISYRFRSVEHNIVYGVYLLNGLRVLYCYPIPPNLQF
jgi:hypothetical protein